MKIGWKLIVATGFTLALVDQGLGADQPTTLKDQKSKVSYAVGMNIGTSLKRSGFDVDVDILAGAIKDATSGNPPALSETEAREVMTAYQQELKKKQEEERTVIAEKNRKAGAEFLTANKAKLGVKTRSVALADGTTAELQYKIITEGTGTTPGSNDTVTVNYKGTLIDGKEFDSSAKHGQAAKFQVNRVIRGWTESLQLMKVGSKFEVYIPSTLAYGDRQSGPLIEPGSTLVFEVELVSVEAPAAPAAPAQPLTSDIIRVPSAEELKKGAKIEVIKPEDAARMAAEEAAKQKKTDSEKK
jgi:FKBP-type peptidyl-prolyl cis-trans isomerase FklB